MLRRTLCALGFPRQAEFCALGPRLWEVARRFGIVVATSWVVGCQPPSPEHPPDVLLVVLDAAAAALFSSYGYERKTTPHFDALASESIRWQRAYAQAPLTVASVASILSGRFPDRTWSGRRIEGHLLPEWLAAAGYQTVGLTENPWLVGNYGFDRGFEEFERFHVGASDADVIDRALAATESGEKPLFLYLHLLPPHSPYAAPAPFRGRYASDPEGERRGFVASVLGERPLEEVSADFHRVWGEGDRLSPEDEDLIRDRYDEHLAFADERLGRLIAGLRSQDKIDDTILIVTADHGEAFGQHGGYLHGKALFDEQIHVPLLIRLPHAARAGEVRPTPARLVDLGATIADLLDLGLPEDEHAVGRSLFDTTRTADEPVHSFLGRTQQSIVQGRHKLLLEEGRSPLLFDWVGDPAEQDDLAKDEPALVEQLGRLRHAVASDPTPSIDDVDPQIREELSELGYVE